MSVAIRPAVAGDAAAIAAIYAPHVLCGTATFETEIPDQEAMRARMASASGRYLWLVAAAGGEVVGYAYAGAFHARPGYRWTVETSVYVADAAQGLGVGRVLYAALLATLTERGFAQAVARIALPHAASVALHEALGFAAVGTMPRVGYKLGRWIDVGIWQRALAAAGDPPQEPLGC